MERTRLQESDADGILPVAIGTAAWAVVLVVLLVSWTRLDADGQLWWIGVAVVGLVSGALGLVFLGWRKRRMHDTPSTGNVAPQE